MIPEFKIDAHWQKVERMVRKNCMTCEFNFGTVCAGHAKRTDNRGDTYGIPVTEAVEMFPKGCDEYGISFEAFCDVTENA